MIERFLTVQEIAQKLCVKERTIHNWIHRGVFPAMKLEGQWRVDPDSFEQWIEERRKNA